MYTSFYHKVEVLYVHEKWVVRNLGGRLGIVHYHSDNNTVHTVHDGACVKIGCDTEAPDEIRVFCGLAGIGLNSDGL